MILFHGSILKIERPLAHVGREHLDFGRGFYLTKIEEQAYGWAKKVKILKSASYLNGNLNGRKELDHYAS